MPKPETVELHGVKSPRDFDREKFIELGIKVQFVFENSENSVALGGKVWRNLLLAVAVWVVCSF